VVRSSAASDVYKRQTKNRLKKKFQYDTLNYFRDHYQFLRIKLKNLYSVVGISKQAHAQKITHQVTEQVWGKDVLNKIATIRLSHPMMGLKKMYAKIKPENIGRDKFIDLAINANLGIQIPKNKRRTTFSTKSKRYKNLLVDKILDDINQVWVSDITYFWVLDQQFLFCIFIRF
jgi:putative transposase